MNNTTTPDPTNPIMAALRHDLSRPPPTHIQLQSIKLYELIFTKGIEMIDYRLIEYELDSLLYLAWKNMKFIGDKVRVQTVLVKTNYKRGRNKPARGGISHDNKNRN